MGNINTLLLLLSLSLLITSCNTTTNNKSQSPVREPATTPEKPLTSKDGIAPSKKSSQQILLSEKFNDLKQWQPLLFSNISNHTTYSIETDQAGSYLKASSKASASAIVYQKEFDIYKYPNIAWQWKVDKVYDKGDGKSKDGDDFPLRIFIVFKYDPEKAGFFERLKYDAAKLTHGRYPPHSTLNYAWANKAHKESIITSPYTDQAKIVLLQKGKGNVGKWLLQQVNIVKDYQRAFSEQPPNFATIAIMSDSDNTGESATSYVRELKIFASTPANKQPQQ